MAVTRAQFLASAPGSQFGSAPAAVVDACLETANRRCNEALFPSEDLAADYICLKAAILLCRHPRAEKMRLQNPDQVFTWEYELDQLAKSSMMGLRVF